MENLKEYLDKIPPLLQKLRGDKPDEQWIAALEDLHEAGVFSRRSILPRGTLTETAKSPLEPDWETQLMHCLDVVKPIEVPRKAALVLGHWGGRSSVEALRTLLNKPGIDSVTQLYCISGLRMIGGREAAEAVIDILDRASNRDVKDAAISAILDLATGGSPSDLEDETINGESRAHGQRLSESAGDKLRGALQSTARQKSAGPRVQRRAGRALDFLMETGAIPPGFRLKTPPPRVYVFPGAILHATSFAPASKAASAAEPQKPAKWDLPEYDLHVDGTPQPGGEYRFEAYARAPELANKTIRFALIGVTKGKPTAEFAIKLDYYSSERDRWEGSEQISVAELPEDSRLVLEGLEA